MRSWITYVTVATVLLGTPVASHAFDDRHKGFVLGFGVGPGLTSFTQDMVSELFEQRTSSRQTKMSIATDLKIGWGFNDQLIVYYTAKVTWFQHDDVFLYDDLLTDDKEFEWVIDGFDAQTKSVWIASGVAGLGVTYFLSPESPFSITAGGGFATWTAPLEDDTWLSPFNDHSQTWFGPGAFAGFGWEFWDHWIVEGTAMWTNPTETGDLSFEVNSNVVSFLLTLNGLLY